ncbi:MAG: electron transfer flavoprotein subunit beta/FixA family protein [Deltaproteobacteria bacterium]|nr:electron transfer flavoprotein subunit beta/FixA family protein [Deltaproteobacteria bacterium]
MKILVALKRVADPDNANKVKIPPTGDRVETTGLEWKPNPFDEYALEAALRLTENGKQPKVRAGEVVVVTFGPKETEITLRAALATGADRAIRVDADDAQLDGLLVARALKAIALQEKPDLIMTGKQAVDGDTNQVGQILAELLDWPMATFCGTLEEDKGGLRAGREVDGGVLYVRLQFPALVTVDLRVVAPTSTYSLATDRGMKYNDGVRFAALPAIMQAKRKPLAVKPLSELVGAPALVVKYLRFVAPPARKAGVIVPDVEQLVGKLKNEAKVL